MPSVGIGDFTLALVMELIGPEALRAKVGADPTGLPFNSVMALESPLMSEAGTNPRSKLMFPK
jgi:glutaminase